jgi:hypothetical protein
LQDWSVEPSFDIEFPGQTELGVRYERAFERFAGLEFDKWSSTGRFSTSWLPWLDLGVHVGLGTSISYYPAAGLAPALGNERGGEVSVTFKPVSQFRVDETYLYSRLDARDADTTCGCTAPTGGAIFSNHIVRTKATYQFTRALSGRAIIDYEAVRPNPSRVRLEDSRRLGVDVLFTYLLNPWTAVYVGYTDSLENLMLPGPGLAPIRSGGAHTSVGRQVFVKLSYLLRY